ncbi:hypothetical protein PPSIR1_34163 [Plesiocystis pacifica SIR-1]|uniref:Uncharacterized protein n=1 Tax=Plesiocystis pacifica SIR-1 TaxID=391625 RepID=A6GF79_9BACT|nr:hypothetical protein [Plesiocystis pacifica]EDM75476.1 hypothetical protein PPSIR1_34163 [Plesiocystis pacifica SIR-1]
MERRNYETAHMGSVFLIAHYQDVDLETIQAAERELAQRYAETSGSDPNAYPIGYHQCVASVNAAADLCASAATMPEFETTTEGSVFILAFHVPVTEAVQRAADVDLQVFYDRYPGTIQLLVMPLVVMPPPPVAVRRMWRDLGKRHPRVQATALVNARAFSGITGTLLTALYHQIAHNLLNKEDVATYGSVVEAAHWLCDSANADAKAERLIELAEGMLRTRETFGVA